MPLVILSELHFHQPIGGGCQRTSFKILGSGGWILILKYFRIQKLCINELETLLVLLLASNTWAKNWGFMALHLTLIRFTIATNVTMWTWGEPIQIQRFSAWTKARDMELNIAHISKPILQVVGKIVIKNQVIGCFTIVLAKRAYKMSN